MHQPFIGTMLSSWKQALLFPAANGDLSVWVAFGSRQKRTGGGSLQNNRSRRYTGCPVMLKWF